MLILNMISKGYLGRQLVLTISLLLVKMILIMISKGYCYFNCNDDTCYDL